LLQQVPQIGISSIVLGELLAGFTWGQQQARNEQELQHFLASPRVTILNITAETPAYYATIYSQLRRQGRPIPTNDMWIAASALEYDYAIFTYDRHFSYIEDVIVVSSLTELE